MYYLQCKKCNQEPYSAKRYWRITLANQQNIALAKKPWRITNFGDETEIRPPVVTRRAWRKTLANRGTNVEITRKTLNQDYFY